MTCSVCAYADKNGWWGQDGTHCRGCCASWRSTSQMHCVQCHRQFSTAGALDLHQPHGTTCVDPAEARTKDGTPKLVAAHRQNCSVTVWSFPPPQEPIRRALDVSPQSERIAGVG